MAKTGYKDRETLIELYHDEGLTQSEIGERFDVSGTTIKRWLDRLEIETTKPRDCDLLEDLRRVGGDEPPSQSTYNEYGEYGVGTVQRRFDGWNAAMQAAGFEPRDQSVSDAELLQALKNLSEELGRSPSQLDVTKHCDHSHKTYYRRFDGGLQEAKRRIGLELYEQNSQNRVRVSCDNPDCDEVVKKVASAVASSEYDYCSEECHYQHKSQLYEGDGNPLYTLKPVECYACGRDIFRADWERERYQRDYCPACWGNSKREIECEHCGETAKIWPSGVMDGRRFCSKECSAAWRSDTIRGERHPRFKQGRRPEYYGPNWHQQRRRALLRDHARCVECGLTEPESLRNHHEELSIHHITPFREFVDGDGVDYQAANSLENLITLCRPCHSRRH